MASKRFVIPGCPTVVIYMPLNAEVPAMGVSPACIERNYAAWTYNVDVDGGLPRGILKHAWLVVRTARGYHIFLDIFEPSPFRAVKRAYRIAKLGDRAHLRHAVKQIRSGDLLDFAVIRLKGKYLEEKREVVLFREPSEVAPEYWRFVAHQIGLAP
mgnify:CR=1 FL=1